MSWWTNIRDTVEGVATGGLAGAFNQSLANKEAGIWHAVTGTPTAADKRKQGQAVQSQIDYYKKQTEIADSAIAKARDQQLAEKRRIEEKQIRSLRRNFKPAGFLDSGSGDIPDKLGA